MCTVWECIHVILLFYFIFLCCLLYIVPIPKWIWNPNYLYMVEVWYGLGIHTYTYMNLCRNDRKYWMTFIANKSPVVRFRARNTLPKAPLLIGLIISKSSMLVLSLCNGCRGVDIPLLWDALSNKSLELSLSLLSHFGFCVAANSQARIYFSL